VAYGLGNPAHRSKKYSCAPANKNYYRVETKMRA